MKKKSRSVEFGQTALAGQQKSCLTTTDTRTPALFGLEKTAVAGNQQNSPVEELCPQ
jgi:hypothetical protein